MQLSFKKQTAALPRDSGALDRRRLADLREGETAMIEHIDLPEEFAVRLMELGFIPGSRVSAARCAPGGDPRVFRVDGAEIALRRDTASRLIVF